MRPVRVLPHVKKLDDALGDFLVRVTCPCGTSRHIEPEALARIAGRSGSGTTPRHLLSGLLACQTCGGSFRRVNAREYGCATYKDGGAAACTNSIRVPGALAEARLLDKLVEEMLSPAGVALLEKRILENVREASRSSREVRKPQCAQVTRKQVEIEQLRSLMKAGTLSQAVAQAAIEKAEEEIRAIGRLQPAKEQRDAARVIRMLPRAAEALRQRVRGENLGLRDPRSIAEGRKYALRDVRRQGAATPGAGGGWREAVSHRAGGTEPRGAAAGRRKLCRMW